MSTYPVAALPSRVARMEEADEPLLAVKRGRPPLHQLLVHFREERNRGRAWSRATARAEEPIISPRGLGTRRCARLQPRSRGGPGKHGRQLWVWFGGGRDTRGVQLRRIFILRGRLPIHRCRDRHLILYRRAKMKRWARRETAQQNHRGAAQNSCCGRSERSVGTDPAESSHCSPQIAQSTSRWFSARGREASAGSDRGSLSHPREEREARSQRCHGYALRTNA